MKRRNIVPIALGLKYRWTTAGWFDYLNLRINGLKFHQSLMDGETAYTDPRIKEAFRVWKNLLDRDFFLAHHNDLDWRQILPKLYRKQAGMLLRGNFLILQLPEKLKDYIGFFLLGRRHDNDYE